MKVLFALTGVVLALIVAIVLGAARPAPAKPAAVAAATPAPVAVAPPLPTSGRYGTAESRAKAVELLGAAVSMREAGDLGIAWELSRQALAEWPDYWDAWQFKSQVEAQRANAERVAAEQERARAAAAAEAAYLAQNNGWSKAEESHLLRSYYDPPRTSGLAAACIVQNVKRAIPYAEWLRWIDHDDQRIKGQVTEIIRRCRADPLDIPVIVRG